MLTFLTFIGCGLSYIGLLLNIFRWGNYEADLAEAERLQEQMGDGAFGKIFQGSVEIIQKSHEYRYLLLAAGLIFTTMCLIGAIQMRRLKKSGYTIYVMGELAPLLVNGVLLGFSFFTGFPIAVTALIAILFVVLYTTQRKYLIY